VGEVYFAIKNNNNKTCNNFVAGYHGPKTHLAGEPYNVTLILCIMKTLISFKCVPAVSAIKHDYSYLLNDFSDTASSHNLLFPTAATLLLA